MTFHASANLIEAGLWFVLACICALQAYRKHRPYSAILGVLTINFVLFGISDLIESRTGAWWRPTGLLVLKGICSVGFAACFAAYYWAWRRAANRESSN